MIELLTLDEIRPQLELSSINTGRSFPIGGRSGAITTDDEMLTASTLPSGEVALQSGQEFPNFVYRGQVQDYGECVPSLAREKSIDRRFLECCRNVAFQDVLEEHPHIRFASQSRLFVDAYGLAQHYGFATEMLDLTLSFDVASFLRRVL